MIVSKARVPNWRSIKWPIKPGTTIPIATVTPRVARWYAFAKAMRSSGGVVTVLRRPYLRVQLA
jgi:hypothetical protein